MTVDAAGGLATAGQVAPSRIQDDPHGEARNSPGGDGSSPGNDAGGDAPSAEGSSPDSDDGGSDPFADVDETITDPPADEDGFR